MYQSETSQFLSYPCEVILECAKVTSKQTENKGRAGVVLVTDLDHHHPRTNVFREENLKTQTTGWSLSEAELSLFSGKSVQWVGLGTKGGDLHIHTDLIPSKSPA